MIKHINRRWALALIAASMFGTAGATVATAGADARPMICPYGDPRCDGCPYAEYCR
jgi:hypothetical protein